MWEYCGMARTDEGLRKALDRIPQIRDEFWRRIKVPGTGVGHPPRSEGESSTSPWRRPTASSTTWSSPS